MRKLLALMFMVLVVSNAVWVYLYADLLTIQKYQQTNIEERDHVIRQVVPMLESLMSDMDEQQIVGLSSHYISNSVVEKDGCVFVGFLGYVFSEDGRLKKVFSSIDIGSDWCVSEL